MPAVFFAGDVEILRGDLAEILYQATRDGTEYIFGDSVTSLNQDPGGVRVTFEHARAADLRPGHRRRRGALQHPPPGLRAGGRLRPRPGPVRVDLQHAELRGPGPGRCDVQRPGPDRGPVRRGRPGSRHRPAVLHRAGPAITIRATPPGSARSSRRHFAGLGWQVPRLLAEMATAADFYFDTTSQIRMDTWSNGRVALIGDAGYAAGPGGNGTGNAVVAACILAGELAAARGDHRAAFGRYEQRLRGYIAGGQKQAAGGQAFLAPATWKKIRQRNRFFKILPYLPVKGLISRAATRTATAITVPDYGLASPDGPPGREPPPLPNSSPPSRNSWSGSPETGRGQAPSLPAGVYISKMMEKQRSTRRSCCATRSSEYSLTHPTSGTESAVGRKPYRLIPIVAENFRKPTGRDALADLSVQRRSSDSWRIGDRPVTDSFGWLSRVKAPVLLSYATFVLIGIYAGGGGVLLLAQMSSYGVDRATIGIMFFTGSAGFVLAGFHNGALIQRLGFRMALAIGGGAYVLAGLYLATRPPFAAFVAGAAGPGIRQRRAGVGAQHLPRVAARRDGAAQPPARVLRRRRAARAGAGRLDRRLRLLDGGLAGPGRGLSCRWSSASWWLPGGRCAGRQLRCPSRRSRCPSPEQFRCPSRQRRPSCLPRAGRRTARRRAAGAWRPARRGLSGRLRRPRDRHGQLGLQLPGAGARAVRVARRVLGQRVLAGADRRPVPDQPSRRADRR